MKDKDKPWENEPDQLVFIDEVTGVECIIPRTSDIDIEYVKAECKKLAKQLYDLRESKKDE